MQDSNFTYTYDRVHDRRGQALPSQDHDKVQQRSASKTYLLPMNADEEYFYGSDPFYMLARAYEGARECWGREGPNAPRPTNAQLNIERWLMDERLLPRLNQPTPPETPSTSSPTYEGVLGETQAVTRRPQLRLKTLTTSLKKVVRSLSPLPSSSNKLSRHHDFSSPRDESYRTSEEKKRKRASVCSYNSEVSVMASSASGSGRSSLGSLKKVREFLSPWRSFRKKPQSGASVGEEELSRVSSSLVGLGEIAQRSSYVTSPPQDETQSVPATLIPPSHSSPTFPPTTPSSTFTSHQRKRRKLTRPESPYLFPTPSTPPPTATTIPTPTFPTQPVWCLPVKHPRYRLDRHGRFKRCDSDVSLGANANKMEVDVVELQLGMDHGQDQISPSTSTSSLPPPTPSSLAQHHVIMETSCSSPQSSTSLSGLHRYPGPGPGSVHSSSVRPRTTATLGTFTISANTADPQIPKRTTVATSEPSRYLPITTHYTHQPQQVLSSSTSTSSKHVVSPHFNIHSGLRRGPTLQFAEMPFSVLLGYAMGALLVCLLFAKTSS